MSYLQAAATAGIVVATAVAGCGGGEAAPQSLTDGRAVFREAGCGTCHTLAAADTAGSAGPNLDDLDLSAAEVGRQVREGGGGMPPYDDRLTPEQIDSVAAFVADESASAGAP